MKQRRIYIDTSFSLRTCNSIEFNDSGSFQFRLDLARAESGDADVVAAGQECNGAPGVRGVAVGYFEVGQINTTHFGIDASY